MALAGLLLAASAATAAARMPGEPDLTGYSFKQYLREFGKAYGENELGARAATFEANLAWMREHNRDAHKTWFAAPNQFMDWTNAEFRARRTKGVIPQAREGLRGAAPDFSARPLPNDVDWRTKSGVITPVKDQGGCGSCWAFSAVETFESALAIATGKPAPVLSEQQVVSCSPNPQHCGGTGGCDGSTQELAFNYTTNVGISLESTYPYVGSTGKCNSRKVKNVAKSSGYVQLPVNNYTALMSAVATVGPVAISLAAGGLNWQLYGGGIIGDSCGVDVDHGVQLVGYGTQGGKDYWIVRNSWGAGWGERGFIRILRHGEGKEPCGVDKTPGDGSACAGDTKPRTYCGVCAILSDSSYPVGVHMVAEEEVVV